MSVSGPAATDDSAATLPFHARLLTPDLARRVGSAAILLPLLLVALWIWPATAGIIAITAGILVGWELAGMARALPTDRRNLPLVAWPGALAATGALIVTGGPPWLFPVVLAGGAIAVSASYFISGGLPSRRPPLAAAYLAAPAVGIMLAHAPLVRALPSGLEWLVVALIGVMAADTAAYFTGKSIGKHRMAPRISPGKTWEGAAGGLLAGGAAVAVMAALMDLNLDTWLALAAGCALAAIAAAGDLAESALKRGAGIKDSGGLIPGHGGVLDRIDSIAPVLAAIYWLAIWWNV